MKPTPPGWPRFASAVFYDDAAKAIDWLCRAFGFEVIIKVEGEGGHIEHCELKYGDDGLVMIGEGGAAAKEPWRRSPRAAGGNTQALMAFVDDCDAHCEHARAAGATILKEPQTNDYGEDYWTDRGYECADLEGHHWWFVQRLRSGKQAP